MGFHFRKSINLAGFRINLSKSGVGYSVGGKGFRFTKKAGGGTRTTTSIPGTGISHVTENSAPKKTNTRQIINTVPEGGENVKKSKSKKNGKLLLIIAVIVCICTLASCFSGGEDEGTTVPSDPTDGQVETSAATNPGDETTPVTEVTEPPTEAPTEAPTDPPATEPEGITFILNTSSHKFHYQSCSSVDDMKASNKSIHTGTREEVIDMGYEPCGRCDP